MKEKLIDEIKTAMRTVITADQMSILCNVLNRTLQNIVIAEKLPDSEARVLHSAQLVLLAGVEYFQAVPPRELTLHDIDGVFIFVIDVIAVEPSKCTLFE